jgi:hypothetical protein
MTAAEDAAPMLRDGDAMVRTADLFGTLHTELIDLLRGLSPDEWDATVGAGEWKVRDVAAHLLDGDLRRISVQRDRHVLPPPDYPIAGYGDLLRYLNDLNAQWTLAARRISPRLLVYLLERTGTMLASLLEDSSVDGEATFAVAWAGQQRSPMWLDIGREYTERWHHQDQIREAVGAAAITAPRFLRPVIQVSLFAMAPALERCDRPDGVAMSITATGPAGGTWHIERRAGRWQFTDRAPALPAARITTTDLVLARLLLHRLPAAQTADVVQIEGDRDLCAAMMGARAVMV